jgi:hypothetical protein
MIDMNEILAKIEAERKARRAVFEEAMASNKAAIFPLLKAADIAVVEVNYDGSSDSGQINDVVAFSAESKLVPLPEDEVTIRLHPSIWPSKQENVEAQVIMCSLNKAIRELCWELLETEHPGWENNDGGQGVFKFHVKDETIELEHGSNIVEVNYDHHEW